MSGAAVLDRPGSTKAGRGEPTPGARAGRASSGTVPVARRLLLANRARLAASVAGVGLALMLILLLDGLSTGIDSRVTVFEDRVGADLYIAQPGTQSLLGSTSVIPTSVRDRVAALPSVRWAAAVRGFFTVQEVGGKRVPAYVVGYERGDHGGPWDLAAGRAPVRDDEVAVGRQLATAAGVGVGDQVVLVGRPFRVVGIAADADMFMASFVFMTHAATDSLLQAPGTTSFVLVGADQPARAAADIRGLGLPVLTRDEIAQHDLALKGQAYTAVLGLLVVVAFGIGTVVIALTVYSTVMEHRREYGVMKAVGAGAGRLTGVVLRQTLVLAAAGLVAAAVLFVVASQLLAVLRPQFAITPTVSAVVRVVVASLAMAAVAAYLPARRLGTMEPAAAFRGA